MLISIDHPSIQVCFVKLMYNEVNIHHISYNPFLLNEIIYDSINKLSIVNIFLIIHSNRYRAILGELVFIDFCNLIHCILMEFYQVAILLIIINSKIYYAQNLKINYYAKLVKYDNMEL